MLTTLLEIKANFILFLFIHTKIAYVYFLKQVDCKKAVYRSRNVVLYKKTNIRVYKFGNVQKLHVLNTFY